VKFVRLKLGLHLLLTAALAVICTGTIAQSNGSLWDMRALSRPPAATWGERNGLLKDVYYEGEPYRGKPTRVFAYFAKPDGPGPFPGMVLVHGGGGTAFSEWALHWAKRGYAAISMNLAGRGPTGDLPDGGPDQSDTTKFRPFQASEANEMWTYHAVAAAIRAHSLLAAQPCVDKNRIGLSGISWGGYLTCIIAGVDHRFKAAVPVYGCGFLHENSVWKAGILDKMPNDLRDRWVRFFDPSQYLPDVRCPILFLNGTNDFAYPMDSYKKSYSLVKSPHSVSVQIRLPHGHIWTYGIVDTFIDSYLRGGKKLVSLGALTVHRGIAEARMNSPQRVTRAELYFTNDIGKWQDRVWQAAPAKIEGSSITAELPSPRPEVFYFAVTDNNGNIVTTEHITNP
jgi:dienelactone hydrolase